ncbi:MAG: DNA polymerase II large subunit [Candidatus Micrarchaeia archaeon]
MDIEEYKRVLNEEYDRLVKVATEARNKGFDPQPFVEIKKAPDLAARVEGITGTEGIAEVIKSKMNGQSNRALAFDVVKELCENPKFKKESMEATMLQAIRAGLAILTDGVLVAPTEGLQKVELHKNPDGSTYMAMVYAGPIRGAGGTAAALSVALGDYARKIFGIDTYKPQQAEVERYVEEIELYDQRIARLQYKPSEDDVRVIFSNCPVCIDGLATHDIEIAVHRDIKRLDANGKEEIITNKIRGALGLVACEGIAQKAKNVIKYTSAVGLDWSWLNSIIKVEKPKSEDKSEKEHEAVFLTDLVAGRPILAYPKMRGSFRLRYGRSRFTGIAAKGFNPATMIILDDFIAIGTQLKVEAPGKGCIAAAVDSIEGPFVKLADGHAFRVNSAEKAKEIKSSVAKILSVGDILVTYGDFKKTNTPLLPTSYVEEYWYEQLKAAGYNLPMPEISSFKEAYEISAKYGVPMHPRYIYDYFDLTGIELAALANAISKAEISSKNGELFSVEKIKLSSDIELVRSAVEKICIPHYDNESYIEIEKDDAQSLLASFGAAKDGTVYIDKEKLQNLGKGKEPLEALNEVAPFKIMQRATRIGARIGRPEKARERLMKPPPNVLFPISTYGGPERNISKAYLLQSKKFSNSKIEVEMARLVCPVGGEPLSTNYCKIHNVKAVLQRRCKVCGRVTKNSKCEYCGGQSSASEVRSIDLIDMVNKAMNNIGEQQLPKLIKGVKGLTNDAKIPEPLEKGILRSMYGVHIFKDGTARFDATDAPITHFYPAEIGTSVEKLRELGYTKDYLGNELTSPMQLVELMHQDVILTQAEGDFFLKVANFDDALLKRFYKLEEFYKITKKDDLVGHFVITLAPHTSAGVLGRIIGFADVNVGFAHPYTISARRRNCDGDEDTTMLALDALINFSKDYLPTTVGGTMDAPIVLTVNVAPEEVDDEVHEMEVIDNYGLEFYEKTMARVAPTDAKIETVGTRLGKKEIFSNLKFTHLSSVKSIENSPKKSTYTKLKTMQEKVDRQFGLMDKLYCVDRRDTARRLILSHFIPDLIGNMHSFFKQSFRCTSCNAKYRRVPLKGVCTRCGGKLTLTISKGSIEKYMKMAETMADRYDLEVYIKQRIMLIHQEIDFVFGESVSQAEQSKQFNLARFM